MKSVFGVGVVFFLGQYWDSNVPSVKKEMSLCSFTGEGFCVSLITLSIRRKKYDFSFKHDFILAVILCKSFVSGFWLWFYV